MLRGLKFFRLFLDVKDWEALDSRGRETSNIVLELLLPWFELLLLIWLDRWVWWVGFWMDPLVDAMVAVSLWLSSAELVDVSSPSGGGDGDLEDLEDLEEKSSMSDTPALFIRFRLRAIVVKLHSVRNLDTYHKQSVIVSRRSVDILSCVSFGGFSIDLRLRKREHREREKSYVITWERKRLRGDSLLSVQQMKREWEKLEKGGSAEKRVKRKREVFWWATPASLSLFHWKMLNSSLSLLFNRQVFAFFPFFPTQSHVFLHHRQIRIYIATEWRGKYCNWTTGKKEEHHI